MLLIAISVNCINYRILQAISQHFPISEWELSAPCPREQGGGGQCEEKWW